MAKKIQSMSKKLAKKSAAKKATKHLAKVPKKVAGKEVAKKPVAKPSEKPAKIVSTKYPRHEKNPFKPGSSYAICFDIMSHHPKGLRRDELVRILAEESGIDKIHAGYNAAVLCSATPSSRHRSCKDGFTVRREADSVTLVID